MTTMQPTTAEAMGPPARPGAGLRSVPDDVLASVLAESLRWHLALDPDLAADGADEPGPAGTDDAVLNACRARHRIRTGEWTSKIAAGQVAARDEEPPGVVAQALAARSGGPMPSRAAARAWQQQVLVELTVAVRR